MNIGKIFGEKMLEEFFDSFEFELVQLSPAFERAAEPYLKFYRYMLIQYIKDALVNEDERKSTYSFITRKEGKVFCEFLGLSPILLRKFFKQICDDERFRLKVKFKIKSLGLRTSKLDKRL